MRATSPFFIARKRVVNVLELAAAADHVVEIETPLQVEIDVTRHVHAEAVRAHIAALHLALREQLGAVDFDFLADRNHADDGRGAARLDTFEALLGELLHTHRLEGVIDATAGQFANRFDRV